MPLARSWSTVAKMSSVASARCWMPSPLYSFRNSSIWLYSSWLSFERDADLVVGRGHRPREQGGLLPLDVEIADLAEVEDPLVELRPMVHPAAVHIVGEVVERVQAGRRTSRSAPGDRLEIDVVDLLGAVAVDQIEVGAADPLDRRNSSSPGPRGFDRGRAALDRQRQRLLRRRRPGRPCALAEGPWALAELARPGRPAPC